MSDWLEVGDRVFVRRYAFFDQNIGVVLGDEGVLLVDTRTTHRHAREVQEHLRELTPRPVSVVVDTHGHSDHAFGNAVFRPAPIWGHVRCVTMLRETGELQRAPLIQHMPEMADDLREVEIDPPDQTFDHHATVEIDQGGRTRTLDASAVCASAGGAAPMSPMTNALSKVSPGLRVRVCRRMCALPLVREGHHAGA